MSAPRYWANVRICRDECVLSPRLPYVGLSRGVEVNSNWRLDDHPGLLGVNGPGAGVVDEESQAVRGEPDVPAFAALA